METAAELYRSQGIELFISTVKGNRFYFSRPTFDIEEIAHATSMQCRFTGHCNTFYSVAEHSVLVATLMKMLDLGDPFEGLMHDAAEAYLSDIAAPWKAMLPDYKRLEGELEEKLRAHFKMPPKMTDGCKQADWLALLIEAQKLLPSKGADFTTPPGVREQAQAIIDDHGAPPLGLSPGMAKTTFLHTYKELTR